MLEPAQLKSRGSFCRKHSWPGWAKAGYRWFISNSVPSQGTCSLGGHQRGGHSACGVGAAPAWHCPLPLPGPSHSRPREMSLGGARTNAGLKLLLPTAVREESGQEGGGPRLAHQEERGAASVAWT